MRVTRTSRLFVEGVRLRARLPNNVSNTLIDDDTRNEDVDCLDVDSLALGNAPGKDEIVEEEKAIRQPPSVESALSINAQRSIVLQQRPSIEKKPVRLSTVRPDYHSTAFGRYLEEIGIHGSDFDRFVELNPRAFHDTPEKIERWRSQSHGKILQEADVHVILRRYPKITIFPIERMDQVAAFLKEMLVAIDSAELRRLLRENPSVFKWGFEEIFTRSTKMLFERFKISMSDVTKLIRTDPSLLTLFTEDDLFRLLSLFSSFLQMSPIQVGRMIQECPQLIKQSIFGLHERLRFLLKYGFSDSQIQQMLMQCPGLLDTPSRGAGIRHVVNYLEAVLEAHRAIVRKIVLLEPSVLRMDTETDIASNIAALKNMGYGRHQMTLILVRCPKVLTLSLNGEETDRKMQFLQNVLLKDKNALLNYPNYFCFSMTECLLPRVEFLQSLKIQDYTDWPLMKLFGESDEEFCTRHIRTVPEKFINFCQTWKQNSRLLPIYAPESAL